MLQEPMMEKLTTMRLLGMVDALKAQEQDPGSGELSFLERLGLLVDHQWNWRENQALARRLYVAKLKGNACVEDIDYRTARGLDKSVIRALAQKSAWPITRTCSCSDPRVWARASSPAHWRRRLVVTVTPRCTRVPLRCSAIWRSHEPTGACVTFSSDSAASTC